MRSMVMVVTLGSVSSRSVRVRDACRMLRSAPAYRLADVSARAGMTAAAAVKALTGVDARGRCAAAVKAAALGDDRASMLLALEHPACPPAAVRALAAARASRVVHTTGSARGTAAWTARDTAEAGPVPSWRLRARSSQSARTPRWHAASDQGCPTVSLLRLSTDPDPAVRYKARSNPSYQGRLGSPSERKATASSGENPAIDDRPAAARRAAVRRSREELEALACSEAWIDRGRAGSDRDTPSELLDQLSHDARAYVRKQVARNRSCQPAVLARLAVDEPDIRATVAENTASPQELLVSLATDPKGEVRYALAANPACPPLVLARLAAVNSRSFRRRIAANPSASPRLLAELAQDSEFAVRKLVAANPACPRSVLIWLRHDTSQQVAEAAERR